MSRQYRTLYFAALNIDQQRLATVDGNRSWRLDSRIGSAFQLNNDYYRHNPWDRGHMARRAAAAWGTDEAAATKASDETYYYSNAALQHDNFNKDEWAELEDWVLDLDQDKNDKITVFSGPIFGDYMRSVRPAGREPGFVPSAFFKVIVFLDKADALQVRSFILPQDVAAMADKNGEQKWEGRSIHNYQPYQSSVREIEELTGLEFPEIIPSHNPLYFTPSASLAATRNITEFPERREVNGPRDVIRRSSDRRPVRFADDEVDVFIAAAMINPKGAERSGEWVSIANLSADPVSLDGWTLRDRLDRVRRLTGTIGPGEAVRIQPVAPIAFANDKRGFIQLVDDQGRQIDRVPYTRQQAQHEGKPVVFAYRADGQDRPSDPPGQAN